MVSLAYDTSKYKSTLAPVAGTDRTQSSSWSIELCDHRRIIVNYRHITISIVHNVLLFSD